MCYTIAQTAKKFGLTTHTLRYYDKEGLLPYVERSDSGIRIFKDSDLKWLFMINCLKNSGVSIRQIRQYIDWCMQGEGTKSKRLEFMEEHKEKIQDQIAFLFESLKMVDEQISQCLVTDAGHIAVSFAEEKNTNH